VLEIALGHRLLRECGQTSIRHCAADSDRVIMRCGVHSIGFWGYHEVIDIIRMSSKGMNTITDHWPGADGFLRQLPLPLPLFSSNNCALHSSRSITRCCSRKTTTFHVILKTWDVFMMGYFHHQQMLFSEVFDLTRHWNHQTCCSQVFFHLLWSHAFHLLTFRLRSQICKYLHVAVVLFIWEGFWTVIVWTA
jgi:hypothetical protein